MKKLTAILLLCLLAVPLFAAPWAREYHKEPKVFVSILAEDTEDVDMYGSSNKITVEIAAESMANTFDRNECYKLMQKTLGELMEESGYIYSNEVIKPYIRNQQHKDYKFTQLIAEYELTR